MRNRLSLSSLAVAVTTLCLAAQAPVKPRAPSKLSADAMRLVRASAESNQVMDHLDFLTNSIGPRLTGSEQLVLACEWAVDRLKGFGLTNAHLENWGEVPVSFNRGPWFGAMNWVDGDAKRRVVLEFNTPAWSAGTKGLRQGPAVLLPQSAEEFEEIKAKLGGAWVVDPAPARSRRGARGSRGGTAPRFDALRACEDAGVRGIVRGAGDGYLRTGSNRRIRWREVSMDALPKLVQVSLVGDQFAQLRNLLQQGVAVELEFNVQNRFRPGPVALYNVVADIPGTEKPDEFVLVGGHIDSWDGATGAVDNGSGCATAMEAARLIMASGLKPRRTIRFVFWSGEEQGLLGSRAYVEQHRSELTKTSVYLNHDSGTNHVAGVPATPGMRADLERVFAGVETIDAALPFTIREAAGLRGGGSDHSSFLGAGVPAWSWPLSGDHNYRHIWHTQHDLYDEVVGRYQKHSALVIAIGAVGIANLDGLLSRDKLVAAGGSRQRFNAGIELDGTKVVSVEADSPFAKAGFKKGDVLVRTGDTPVESLRDVLRAVFRAGGEPVPVTVRRGGKELSLKVAMQMRRR